MIVPCDLIDFAILLISKNLTFLRSRKLNLNIPSYISEINICRQKYQFTLYVGYSRAMSPPLSTSANPLSS